MPNTQWYYTDAQRERQGPVATPELKQLVAQGGLEQSALVWREGMGQWQPVQDFAQELALPAANAASNDGINPYAAPTAAVAEPVVEVDDQLRDYADFVGNNFDSYRLKWRLDEKQPSAKDTWHWPAFFFGIMWMLYRKMYALAAMWACGSTALAATLALLDMPDMAGLGINIGIAAAAGSLGNTFYLKHAQKQIQQAKSGHRGGVHALRAELHLRGGTSGFAVVVGLVVMVGFNVVIAVALG